MEKGNRLILITVFLLVFQLCYSQDSIQINDVVNGKLYKIDFSIKSIQLNHSNISYRVKIEERGSGRYIKEVKLFRVSPVEMLLDTKYIYDHYNKITFMMKDSLLQFFVDDEIKLEIHLSDY